MPIRSFWPASPIQSKPSMKHREVGEAGLSVRLSIRLDRISHCQGRKGQLDRTVLRLDEKGNGVDRTWGLHPACLGSTACHIVCEETHKAGPEDRRTAQGRLGSFDRLGRWCLIDFCLRLLHFSPQYVPCHIWTCISSPSLRFV